MPPFSSMLPRMENQGTVDPNSRLPAAMLLLRIGIAFSFLYAASGAFLNPSAWIGFFPQVFRNLAPSEGFLLQGFGASEIALALWLLSGWKIFFPSVVAVLMLAGIVAFNIGALDIVFRDVSLALAALALAVLSRQAVR